MISLLGFSDRGFVFVVRVGSDGFWGVWEGLGKYYFVCLYLVGEKVIRV